MAEPQTRILRRPRIAAAARPNRIVIGGAGTSCPPEEPLLELLELELLDEDDPLLLPLDELEPDEPLLPDVD